MRRTILEFLPALRQQALFYLHVIDKNAGWAAPLRIYSLMMLYQGPLGCVDAVSGIPVETSIPSVSATLCFPTSNPTANGELIAGTDNFV